MTQTDELIASLVAQGVRKPLPNVFAQTSFSIGLIAAWLGFIGAFEGLRPDFAIKMDEIFYLPELIALMGAALSAAFAAFVLSRPDSLQIPWVRFVPFGFLIVWVICAAMNAPMPHEMPPLGQMFNPKQFDCSACILSISVPPGILMFLMVRAGAPVDTGNAGALSMLSITSLTYLFMRFIEQNDDPFHLLFFHAVPVLVVCLIGYAAGKKFLKWK
jgi:hypothetical protein